MPPEVKHMIIRYIIDRALWGWAPKPASLTAIADILGPDNFLVPLQDAARWVASEQLKVKNARQGWMRTVDNAWLWAIDAAERRVETAIIDVCTRLVRYIRILYPARLC